MTCRWLAAALTVAMAGQVGAAEFLWWEAEKPLRSNFPADTGLTAKKLAKPEVLSGNDWLTFQGAAPAAGATAAYRIEVTEAGTYHFWTRKFWKHGPFQWRFDDGAWNTCGPDVALADNVEIQPFICVNWVSLGDVALDKGAHLLTIQLLSKPGESVTAAFDCFLLTQEAFEPKGKLKPGEKSGEADLGYFAFEPGLDPFRNDALIDLRPLNEKTAGEKGYIKRSGDRLVLGSGEPVRLWAVGAGNENAGQSHASVDYLAARLAKLGVNMVRFHSPLFDRRTPVGIDPQKLDHLHYLVFALKQRGIYTTLSFYFPLWLDADTQLGFKDYAGRQQRHPFALLMFDPAMQQLYREWARTILTTKNPYTGLPLGRDPAVAIVEIQNEDSFFFWTFNSAAIAPTRWEALERRFGTYLEKKYGSIANGFAAFEDFPHPNDRPREGQAGLFDAWHMSGDGFKNNPAKQKRIAVQVRFLAELQRGCFADLRTYFRQQLGYAGLVDAGNWTTVDPRVLDSVERWTYTAGDVIDGHGYFSGKQEGEGSAYRVAAGQTFISKAAVKSPGEFPLALVQPAGFPQIVSELGFPQPNQYRADAPVMAAAYGALQGIDGLYFFAVNSNYLLDSGINKFQVGSPAVAGEFPALALMYRRGDLEIAKPAATRDLSEADLWALTPEALSSAEALDALRRPGAEAVPSAAGRPLTFYQGPVQRNYGLPTGAVRVTGGGTSGTRISSATGQLELDHGTGLLTIHAPRVAGVTGFLQAAGKTRAGPMTVESGNEFGTVMLIALDGQTLEQSKRLLLQVMTQEQPYGFKTTGTTIKDVGGPPFGVKQVQGTVRLTLPEAGTLQVRAVDENGYGIEKGVKNEGGAITLAPEVLYYVLTR